MLAAADGGRFKIVDGLADPTPGKGEIVIRLAAASINAIDTLMRAGYGESLFKWLRKGGPVVLGLDGAGIVAAVGEGVTRFKAGERVMAAVMPFRSGFYAEKIAVPAAWAARIPDGVSMQEAAALPYAGLTVFEILRAARLNAASAKGRRVLVHGGSGGIGSLLVQILHAWGAWVASTCRTQNVAFVRSLGADQVVDYTREDFTRVLKELDVVVQTVAPKDERLVEAPHFSVLKRGGIFASLISPTLTLVDRLTPPLGLAAFGIWTGVARARWAAGGKHHRWVYFKPSGKNLAQLAAWVEQGLFRPQIAKLLPLEQVAEAQRLVEQGPARGKVLLALDPSLLPGRAAA